MRRNLNQGAMIRLPRALVGGIVDDLAERLLQRRLRAFATNLPGVVYQFYVRRDGSLWFTYLSESSQEMRFLRTPDWEAGLDEALALIGEAAGVSRSYLFRTRADDDGAVMVGQVAEWVADGRRRRVGRYDVRSS